MKNFIAPSAAVTPSADCIFVILNVYLGFGTVFSKSISVQPSVKNVRTPYSSAIGAKAGGLLEDIQQKCTSILSTVISFSTQP